MQPLRQTLRDGGIQSFLAIADPLSVPFKPRLRPRTFLFLIQQAHRNVNQVRRPRLPRKRGRAAHSAKFGILARA